MSKPKTVQSTSPRVKPSSRRLASGSATPHQPATANTSPCALPPSAWTPSIATTERTAPTPDRSPSGDPARRLSPHLGPRDGDVRGPSGLPVSSPSTQYRAPGAKRPPQARKHRATNTALQAPRRYQHLPTSTALQAPDAAPRYLPISTRCKHLHNTGAANTALQTRRYEHRATTPRYKHRATSIRRKHPATSTDYTHAGPQARGCKHHAVGAQTLMRSAPEHRPLGRLSETCMKSVCCLVTARKP